MWTGGAGSAGPSAIKDFGIRARSRDVADTRAGRDRGKGKDKTIARLQVERG